MSTLEATLWQVGYMVGAVAWLILIVYLLRHTPRPKKPRKIFDKRS